jgi:hypothetical protein
MLIGVARGATGGAKIAEQEIRERTAGVLAVESEGPFAPLSK